MAAAVLATSTHLIGPIDAVGSNEACHANQHSDHMDPLALSTVPTDCPLQRPVARDLADDMMESFSLNTQDNDIAHIGTNPAFDPALRAQHTFHRDGPHASSSSISDATEYDDDDDDEDEEENENDVGIGGNPQKYDLRESARQLVAPSAWIDKDDSGNYNPAEERKRAVVRRKPTGSSATSLHDACSRPVAKQIGRVYKSLETGRVNGAQLIFTINLAARFTGQNLSKASSLLDEISDHWPQEPYNYLDEDYFDHEELTGSRLDRKDSFLTDEARDRTFQCGFDENGDYIPYADPLGIEETLEGHPSARGCVQCRKGDWECSLLGNRYLWPCEACFKDEEDCQLIAPPKRKASCEGCKARKIKCSYRDQLEQAPKCNDCTLLGAQCIAGPAPGYEPAPTRFGEQDIDRPSRNYVSCTSCREQKTRCSLKKDDPPPCTGCTGQIPCIFEPVRRSGLKAKAKSKATVRNESINVEMVDRDSDQDSEIFQTLDPRPLPPDTRLNALKPSEAPCFDRTINTHLPVFTIHTAFCHPITFDCDMTLNQFSDAFKDCSFCIEPMFAVYGHYDFVYVKVQENYKGLCYEEKSKHGHYAHNKPPTRICSDHTMDRYHIIGCRHEAIEPLDDQVKAAIHSSFMGPAAEVHIDRLCSLCPSPMALRCAVPFSTDRWGQSTPAPVQGCGLQLCSYCHQNLTKGFGGRLDELLEDMIDNGGKYELGKRADIELLARNGLLVRNVHADLERAA